jgi:hypothetical protein
MRVSCQMIESWEMSRIFPHSIPNYQFKNENLQGFVISWARREMAIYNSSLVIFIGWHCPSPALSPASGRETCGLGFPGQSPWSKAHHLPRYRSPLGISGDHDVSPYQRILCYTCSEGCHKSKWFRAFPWTRTRYLQTCKRATLSMKKWIKSFGTSRGTRWIVLFSITSRRACCE